jgi:hypothetical protein
MNHSLILENTDFARNVAYKFAIKYNKHVDECVAESWFQLVMFFKDYQDLYDRVVAEGREYKLTLGLFLKRKLLDYFKVRQPQYVEQDKLEVSQNNLDEEMVDWLSGVLNNDEQVWKVMQYLREGMDFEAVELLDRKLYRAIKIIRKEVYGRIRRLKKLKESGMDVSREIKEAAA